MKINDTPAEDLTLLEAQLEIHESGRHLKLFVKGYEKLIAQWENKDIARVRLHAVLTCLRFLFSATKTKTARMKTVVIFILSHVSKSDKMIFYFS